MQAQLQDVRPERCREPRGSRSREAGPRDANAVPPAPLGRRAGMDITTPPPRRHLPPTLPARLPASAPQPGPPEMTALAQATLTSEGPGSSRSPESPWGRGRVPRPRLWTSGMHRPRPLRVLGWVQGIGRSKDTFLGCPHPAGRAALPVPRRTV